jgi:hypothetical protein
MAGLSVAAAALNRNTAAASAFPIPIIDAHIHLFDPLRPGGVPWPEKTDAAI